jgi:hypothetical protein
LERERKPYLLRFTFDLRILVLRPFTGFVYWARLDELVEADETDGISGSRNCEGAS